MDEYTEVADSNEQEFSYDAEPKQRRAGRPSKAEVLERQKARIRTPITGEKSLLDVQGKKPGWSYRWVRDTDEAGSNIIRYLSAGYEFASRSEGLIIGDNAVYTSKAVGSIVRVPAGRDGDYLYLMRIPQEWYDEDQDAKSRNVDDKESSVFSQRLEGGYGEVKKEKLSF